MSPTVLAVIGIVVMIGLMFLRMPVSFALLLVGGVGAAIMVGPSAAAQLLSAETFRMFTSYSLAVVPLFILMGQVVFRAGLSAKLYDTAHKWVGSLPGGVAATTILASVGFGAMTGSNAATTATMGAVALPEMKRYKYNPSLAGGSVAIGGTLGILIPPSTALIIVAVQAELSISDLFIAAVVPGLLVGGLLVATVLVLCRIRPELGPPGPRSGWGERFRSLTGVTDTLILFLLVIGGLYLGWFTPTESGAAGAFGAIVIAFARGKFSFKLLWTAILETLRVSAMVVLLVASAVVFGRFLALTRLPFDLADWVGSLAVPSVVVLLVIIFIYLLGGAFMDALGFLVISIPIFYPLAANLGYDLVWFTIIVTLVTTLGAVTPPVGVNVFIVAAMDKAVSAAQVFRGTFIFIIPYAVATTLVIVFPALILTPS